VDNIGGVNTFIFELSAAFIKLGYSVDIVTYTSNKPRSFYSEIYSIPIDEIPKITCLQRNKPVWPPKTSITNMLLWFFLGSKKVFENKPVLVIVNGMVPLLRIGRHPVIVAVNHGIVRCSLFERIMLKKIYEWFCDYVITISDRARYELASYYGIRKTKMIKIPLCLNTSRVSRLITSTSTERENAFIHVDTSISKNLVTTLKTFKVLKENFGSNIRLYIAGANEQYIKESLSTLGLGSERQIQYLGLITRDILASFYAKSKACILPSFYEAFPYSLIESMSMGTPAVVSGAIPKELVIHSYNGYRVNDPLDYKSFAKYIGLLLGNKEIWEKNSENAILTARKFDCKRIAGLYLELIKDPPSQLN